MSAPFLHEINLNRVSVLFPVIQPTLPIRQRCLGCSRDELANELYPCSEVSFLNL